MFKSGLSFRGRLQIAVVNPGKNMTVIDDSNIVLNIGKQAAASWLYQGSSYKISKVAVGNGNTSGEAASPDDTSLQNELKQNDLTNLTIDTSNNWVTAYTTFSSGSPEFDGITPAEINECALILNNGVDDIYFAKKNIPGQPFEHSNNVTLAFVWRIWVP